MSDKPVIFISYSHKDEPENPRGEEVAWLSFVRTYLQPAIKNGVFDLWDDRQLIGGADWDPEIEEKLRACDIFILLVSPNSMASDYIIDREIALIRERQTQGEPVHFYPLLLTPTPDDGLQKVKDKNLRPRDARPFSGFQLHDRMQHMTEAANEIGKIAKEVSSRKGVKRPIISPSRPAHVHISGLPETAYERLVGRDDELNRLDEAWRDGKTNILSLVAAGGVGKSALINEWLRRIQAKNYGGAEMVLGWSFYNQGTKERASSADEFLNWALAKLDIAPLATSSIVKAEAICEAMMRRRILLLLDGLEPLQHGLDARLGELRDAGLRSLLRRFAATPPLAYHGLIVLTSRLAVKDIGGWRESSAPLSNIEQLSDEAGVALLRDNSVWGNDRELIAATRDFAGHPLALALLGSFLKETQTGDVRRRDHIRAYFADQDNPLHDHARRVMESYEKEWLVAQPSLHAIMNMVGLFDRPASDSCLRALREKPIIEGLTDEAVDLSEDAWQRAVTRLREGRLLAPPDELLSNALDAHPLVREWFGEKLRAEKEEAWRLANDRLYEYLCQSVKDRKSATLQELIPLYQAVPHGCRAARHQDVLDGLYRSRLSRKNPDGTDMRYTFYHLGTASTDLAAISWFFDRPFEEPVTGLNNASRRWVLATSGLYLYSQGRLAEAKAALQMGLKIDKYDDHPADQDYIISLLGNIAFVTGDLREAKEISQQRVKAARLGRSKKEMIIALILQSSSLIANGDFDAIRKLLVEINQIENQVYGSKKIQQVGRAADDIQSEILLFEGDFLGARKSASRGLRTSGLSSLVVRAELVLLIARANFGLALRDAAHSAEGAGGAETKKCVQAAHEQLNKGVEQLRLSARLTHVPTGYRTRSAFRRCIGDWDGAMLDILEIEEIAGVKPMPMKLYLCETAIERARLAFAQIEVFAPLNGMLEDSPPKPVVPSAEEIATLKDEAAKQIKIADDYIQTCGYHRRDEELAELYAVLRDEKKFAELPPRV